MCVYHIFLNHSSVVGHLNCFHSFTVVNSVAISLGVQVSLLYPGTFLQIYACKWYFWIVWQLFLFFWQTFILLSIVVTLIYYSQQQCKSVPFSPHPCLHLLLFVALMVAIQTAVRWNLNVVSICISFIARDVEHFFICLSFVLLLLKIVYSVHLPISSLHCWLFGSLVFWAPCIFWLWIPFLLLMHINCTKWGVSLWYFQTHI
jgi:hypothetical protein